MDVLLPCLLSSRRLEVYLGIYCVRRRFQSRSRSNDYPGKRRVKEEGTRNGYVNPGRSVLEKHQTVSMYTCA
jgi:hypothetical protein